MRILAIETSCDETAIALLEITGPLEKPEVRVLGNALYSQVKLHAEYGGVHPGLAKREHEKNLPILLEKVLGGLTTNDLQLTTSDIDFIAVTSGPGLEPALWNGITFALELGKKWGKVVLPTDHLEGHIYSVLSTELNSKSEIRNSKSNLEMPAIALIISGGHTELVYIRNFGDYEILGRTLDDAVGEAFDKVARMLGLPYPGGPAISALAEIARNNHQAPNYKLPRPMISSGTIDFSFSGLKTAVLYKLKALGELTEQVKLEMALEFETAVLDVLVEKTRQALTAKEGEVKTLIIAGGVASSAYVKERFANFIKGIEGVALSTPEKPLATDNAVMIALASYVEVTLHPELLC